MKKTWINKANVRGYLFSHTLKNKMSKAGVPFIGGEICVATDEEGMNIVPVNFSYVPEVFAKSGKPNATYAELQKIIDANGENTFEKVGKDAMKVRIDGDVEVNDFYTREGELASPKRLRGSFLHKTEEFEGKANFETDILLSGAFEKEGRDGSSYVELKGYIFNFTKQIMPVTFNIRSQGGMDYFLGNDISSKNPLLTTVRGNIVSTTIVKEKVIESAFGEDFVEKSFSHVRSWDVFWAAKEPMEWDDESTLTKEELKECLANREVMLAERKANQEKFNKQKQKSTTATSIADNEDYAF